MCSHFFYFLDDFYFRGRPVNATEVPVETRKNPPKSAPVAGAARTVEGKVVRPPSKVGLVRAGDDQEDFGQTYPTPRDDSSTATVGIQTDPTPRPVRTTPRAMETPREPVAYYLPMENSSAIKIGTKALKKSAGEGSSLGKENRSILANYVAGLDASAVDIDARRVKILRWGHNKRVMITGKTFQTKAS